MSASTYYNFLAKSSVVGAAPAPRAQLDAEEQPLHSRLPASSLAATTSSASSSSSLSQCSSLASTCSSASTSASSRPSALPRPTAALANLASSPLMVSIGEDDSGTATAALANLNLSSGCSSGASSSADGSCGPSFGSAAHQASEHQRHRQHHYSPSSQMFHSHTLHSLEPKSFKPFKTSSEYVEAMKEDLAEWLNKLYPDLDLTPENFFSQLETGSIVCRHANYVTQMGRNFMLEQRQCQTQPGAAADLAKTAADLSAANFYEQNNNNIGGPHQPISLMSSQSPTNSSDSDKGISLASSCSQSSGRHGSCSKRVESNDGVTSGLQLTKTQNNTSHVLANQNGARKTSQSHFQLTSFDVQRRASSPNNYYSISPTLSTSSSSSSSKTIDKHNINWFRVKIIPFKQNACPGTFFARDNICQFILWCRSLNILECLLFETDDLVARKNVKSFILCLLEVARIGFKVGMPTPLIIQLEQEIDREIENDAKLQEQLEREKQNPASANDCDSLDFEQQLANERLVETAGPTTLDQSLHSTELLAGTLDSDKTKNDQVEKVQDEVEEEEEEDFAPKPQVITNDLVSLHEKVVQLLCQCTCPTQFPMVRIGDGKYKVGDKLIIFVRILRRHIMVRVGGGWQELSEFLRQKDPCRSRTIQASSIQQLYSSSSPSQNHHQHLISGKSTSHQTVSKSRLLGSSHQLNKSHNSSITSTGSGNSYRNSNGHRLISSSASMSWLSSNGN